MENIGLQKKYFFPTLTTNRINTSGNTFFDNKKNTIFLQTILFENKQLKK
jgi:hypothetical protein